MRKSRNGLPPNCTIATDRHGKRRIRFRRKGVDTYLPYPPLGEEFEKAYAAALAGVKDWQANIGSERTRAGSISALAVSYYRSPEFTGQRETTQKVYRGIVERFRVQHGNKLVSELKREHIKAIIGSMSATPAAANRLLSLLRIMLNVALDNGWVSTNVAVGLKGYSKKTDGFHSWTDEEIQAYEQRHPAGSKARLALALLLYTAQRRGDVVRLGWKDVYGTHFKIKQSKTGKPLILLIHDDLWGELHYIPQEQASFLQTEFGKPFTAEGFGNWFRDRCNEAGLQHCSAHGLRKAAARRIAEAGLSGDTIKAVTGHNNLSTVTIYTNAANQALLADRGIQALTSLNGEPILSNLKNMLDRKEVK